MVLGQGCNLQIFAKEHIEHKVYQKKDDYDVFELVDYAVAVLKKVGFVAHKTSLKSIATYYKLPGRVGVLRVAIHGTYFKKKVKYHGLDKVVSSIVFKPTVISDPGKVRICWEAVDMFIALAVGKYFVFAEKENAESSE